MKTCSLCKEDKSFQDFAFRNKAKGTYQSACRSCVKVRDAEIWGTGNKKQTTEARRNEVLERNRAHVWSVLISTGCKDCGNTNPHVLEFDHLRDKEANISAVMRDWSLEKLKQEIVKCEVVCANCHKIRTSSRAGWWRTVRL